MKRRIICAVGASFALASCSMIESARVGDTGQPVQQASGSYFLPKHVLQIVLNNNAQTPPIPATMTASVVAVPDPDTHMQVGFDLSALSDDSIQVDYENGLLKQVATTAIDHTGDIVVALAKDFGALRSGSASNAINITAQLDPFDFREALAINKRLGAGNCVEVEVAPGVWSPGCPPAISMRGRLSRGAPVVDAAPTPPVPSSPGIYYRRAMPHLVHLVASGKDVELKNYLFANNSPVLRVDIDRTAFVTRQTTVQFTAGELTSVAVKKGSEAYAIAQLPVQIVDAYFGGVVDALTQRTAVQNATANYLNAQATTLNTATSLQKALAQSSPSAPNLLQSAPALTGPPLGGGLSRNDCISAGFTNCPVN
jgi:hypothetical protein